MGVSSKARKTRVTQVGPVAILSLAAFVDKIALVVPANATPVTVLMVS